MAEVVVQQPNKLVCLNVLIAYMVTAAKKSQHVLTSGDQEFFIGSSSGRVTFRHQAVDVVTGCLSIRHVRMTGSNDDLR